MATHHSKFTDTTCPNCCTYFDRLPFERDEDGYGCSVLPVTPCAAPTCGTLLCSCCDQFHCDGCGDTFCADHMISIPDGETPLRCCPACADEVEPLPAAIPPQSETRPARYKVEVA